MSWFAALGNGLLSAAADIFNNERKIDSAWNLQKDAQSFNRLEREAAQVYNTSEREAAQEWNSEAAQLERLMSVGVNPNNAVGIISHGGSTPASISPTSSPLSAVPQMANPMSGIADFALLDAQIRNIDADTNAKEIENRYKDESLQLDNEQKRAAIVLARSDSEYKKSLKGLTDKEIAKYDEIQDTLIKEGVAKIEQYEAAVRELNAQVKLIEEQEATERRKRKSMDASDAASYASAAASNASAGLSSAQMETEDAMRESRVAGQIDQNMESRARAANVAKDTILKSWEICCNKNGILPKSGVAQNIGFMLASESAKKREIVSSILGSAKRAVVSTIQKSDAYKRKYGKNKPYKVKARQWNP